MIEFTLAYLKISTFKCKMFTKAVTLRVSEFLYQTFYDISLFPFFYCICLWNFDQMFSGDSVVSDDYSVLNTRY